MVRNDEYSIGPLKKGEEAALIDLLQALYIGREKHVKRAVCNEPFFRRERIRVARYNNVLTACLHIHKRLVYFHGRHLLMGGIGGVATHPAHRRKGLARRLLEDATVYMRKKKYDLSVLFGEPAIYEKSGWQTLTSFSLHSKLPLFQDRLLTMRKARPDDLKHLQKWYVQFNGKRTGPVLRNRKYWELWIKQVIQKRFAYKTYIVSRCKLNIGYFVCLGPGEIVEIGCDITNCQYIDSMVKAIYSKLSKAGTDINWHFFMPDLFDSIRRCSSKLHLDELRNKSYFVTIAPKYAGLCKLISTTNKALSGIGSTDDLITILRENNYISWARDHF